MNVYFSGIGGTAIGPLALIAHQAGYDVYGSDKQNSQYIEYLKKLSEKRPFIWDEPEARLKEFKETVGDPDAIQKEMFKYVQKLK